MEPTPRVTWRDVVRVPAQLKFLKWEFEELLGWTSIVIPSCQHDPPTDLDGVAALLDAHSVPVLTASEAEKSLTAKGVPPPATTVCPVQGGLSPGSTVGT